jgi:hypothetical protein
MNVVDYVNELPPTSRLGPLGDYLREESLDAPVDMYYRSIREILRYGTPERLLDSDFLGRLLVIGIVSAAEAYFRAILSACIELCPLARSAASKRTINLGGLLWHGQSGFSRSVFEHASLASKDELTRACRDFIGINLDDKIFKSLLDQFEIVCQLRHGIAHADGLLAGRNAVQLDIKRFRKPVRIVLRYEQLQDVAAVVNTLVMTLNRHLFSIICHRWGFEWRKREDWEPSLERAKFRLIWNIFHCVDETKSRSGRSKVNKANCLKAVKALYNIPE